MSDIIFRGTGGLDEVLANGAALLKHDPVAAAEQAREIIRVNPNVADAHRLLGAALKKMGRIEEANEAQLAAVNVALHDATLREAALALANGRLEPAEELLRPYLRKKPNDAAALRMLGVIAMKTGHFGPAEQLLRQAVRISPRFAAAQEDLDRLIELRDGQKTQAIPEGTTEFEAAIRTNEELVAQHPDKPGGWLSYGHVLRIAGRQEDSIAAYRKALELAPAYGEAWWSLADLKTGTLGADDVPMMERALMADSLTEDGRVHLHFALGRTLEDLGRHDDSFHHYAQGNRLRHAQRPHDADAVSAHVTQSARTFTDAFFDQRRGWGSPEPDPIFIVGMPRSGSTLLEQILSSHPMIEGTEELRDILLIANQLAEEKAAGFEASRYLETVASLTPVRVRMTAESYLARTRDQRKSTRPHFIDKTPENWLHIGLIRLILPNAKIIDARRHPLGCCVSNFRQHFARGQDFTYDLGDLGQYYSDYVRLMSRVDAVLPGRVHRVIYERMVDETETEIRALLDYCGLEFEPACLAFHETERAVRTASSEQVRQPIYRDATDEWQRYDAHLGPLKQALGATLEAYPDVPGDFLQP